MIIDPGAVIVAALCLILAAMFTYAAWKTRRSIWLVLSSLIWVFIGVSFVMLFV